MEKRILHQDHEAPLTTGFEPEFHLRFSDKPLFALIRPYISWIKVVARSAKVEFAAVVLQPRLPQGAYVRTGNKMLVGLVENANVYGLPVLDPFVPVNVVHGRFGYELTKRWIGDAGVVPVSSRLKNPRPVAPGKTPPA